MPSPKQGLRARILHRANSWGLPIKSGPSGRFGIMCATLIALVAFGLAGCGGGATIAGDQVAAGPSIDASQLAASPARVSFGTVAPGSSATQVVTLSNTGQSAVNLSEASVTGPGFSISNLALPMTLAPGANTSFYAKFTPPGTGNSSGSISVASNAPNSPLIVSLSAGGAAAQLIDSPSSLNFGNVATGSSSSLPLKLTNGGAATVTISKIAISGTGFTLIPEQLPVSLSAGQAITLTVTYAPVLAPGEAAASSGSLSIWAAGSNSPLTVPLSGAGVSLHLSASPANVSFGSVSPGGSATATITLTNSGGGSITITQATVSGAGFGVRGLAFPSTLAAGQSESFTATFAPASAASSTGSISVVSTASNSPLGIGLSGGSGAAATGKLTANPASLSFGNVTVGNNSILPVFVTNSGSASVTITQASTTGSGFSVSGSSMPITLAAGQGTSLSVTFNPAGAGGVSGNLSIISNASNSPMVATLSATGVVQHSVSLIWIASTSAGVAGYNVYRGTVSGGPYSKLTAAPVSGTSYTDSTVQSGQTYFYVTTAVNAQGVESSDSNQATAVIPSS